METAYFRIARVRIGWAVWLTASILMVFLSFGVAPASRAATTTTFNFDDLANGTILTTQYQSRGITASGATITDANALGFTPRSGSNVAYSPGGILNLTINPTILGQIKTVAAYVSGPINVGIYAYDAGGALLGQALLTSPGTNVLLSVTSSGNPIATVSIHDDGGTFAVDDLSFTTASTDYALANLGLGGAAGTVTPAGINAAGRVAGVAGTIAGTQHGFFYDGTLTIDVGTFGGTASSAKAVSARNQVVGSANLTNGASHAFSWTSDDGLRDLGSPTGGNSVANAVNTDGKVVGSFSTNGRNFHAFAWTAAGGMIDLGTFGGPISAAAGVNANGDVVGYATTPAGMSRAFLHDGTTLTNLGVLPGGKQSYATTIKGGQVIGGTDFAGGQTRAFSWTAGGGMADLGTLSASGSTVATALNETGLVVGYSSTVGTQTHAVTWSAGSPLNDLGTLGGPSSAATAVNGSGQVVGYADTANGRRHAFLWTASEGMVDLNSRIPTAPAGLELTGALAISDNGQIVVTSNAGLLLLGGTPTAPVVGPITAPTTVKAGTAVSLSAKFTDVNPTDNHTASWTWNDGSLPQAGGIVESGGAGTASGSHTFAAPGTYTVSLTVTDTNGRVAKVSTTIVVTKK